MLTLRYRARKRSLCFLSHLPPVFFSRLRLTLFGSLFGDGTLSSCLRRHGAAAFRLPLQHEPALLVEESERASQQQQQSPVNRAEC